MLTAMNEDRDLHVAKRTEERRENEYENQVMARYMCQQVARQSISDASISLSLSPRCLAVCGPARGSSFTNHFAEREMSILTEIIQSNERHAHVFSLLINGLGEASILR